MADPLLTPGLTAPQSSASIRALSNVAKPEDHQAAARGARFEALLEELDQRARALSQSAQGPLSAESLPEAVASARNSLEDALQLSRDLLEAVRQTSAQSGAALGPKA